MQKDESNAAFREEQTVLDRFQSLASQEIQKCKEALPVRIPNTHDGDANNVHQDIASAHKKQEENQFRIGEISSTLDKPYFVRFNVEDDGGKIQTVYIGDQSISLGRSDFLVFRWQEAGGAPLIDYLMRNELNIPFSSDRDKHTYTCLLKRRIEIERRRLLDVDDVYISDETYAKMGINDEFLIKVIRQRRKEGISAENIISTIQRNQYEIISYPLDRHIVVQGCAGSGKTYIMMNRLSYLLLNKNRFHIAPDDTLVISPNPRIKDQLQNVIKNLSIVDVQQTTIEEWYISILQRLFGINYDNCVIGEEAALPSDYANAVFSSNFIANIRTAIQSERTSIVNEGVMLLKNPALSGYPEYRENTQVSNTHLNTIVESVRSISHKDRTRREALAKFCKENNITDEMLESTPVDADETIEQLQEQLDEIDEHLTQLLGLQPLFDEYNTAKELLSDEETTFNRHFQEARVRLQSSMEQMKNLSSMPAKSRTELVTRHLRYENDVASFEADGTNGQIHQKQMSECQMLIRESLDKTLPLLPVDYRSLGDQAWDQIHTQITSLMQQKQELSDRAAQIRESSRIHNLVMSNAIKLKSALLDTELAKSVDAYARKNASLPRYAISIARNFINTVKDEYKISQVSQTDSVNSKQERRQVLYRSDLFFYLFAACEFINQGITRWKLICIDEAQDISPVEFAFMQKLCKEAFLNIFGDLSQGRLNRLDAIQNWDVCFPQAKRFVLNENYRNARQITQFINERFSKNMIAIGIDGKLHTMAPYEKASDTIKRWTKENGHAIIIAKNRLVIDRRKELADALRSSKHVEFYSIEEVRGLEFSRALVLSEGMDDNEKYIAYTRAMSELVIV